MVIESPDDLDAPRLLLLQALAQEGYRFRTPAPSTQHRVRAGRFGRPARTLEDVFGWSLPFVEHGPLACWGGRLAEAGALERLGLGRVRSRLRVASVGRRLFLHSAFPAPARDGVFFGPDSYRFADFIASHAGPPRPQAAILDVGAGAGVGGIVAAGLWPGAQLTLSDVNAQALGLARVNAAAAGLPAGLALCPGVPDKLGSFDLILANPPYIGGGKRKTYSNGGKRGMEMTLDWTRQALAQLSPSGRFLLYSGSPIGRGGCDALRPQLETAARVAGCSLAYGELDPDVFPSSLLHRAYWGVERIAAIGAVFAREDGPKPRQTVGAAP